MIALPQIKKLTLNNPNPTLHKTLLICGLLSTAWYLVVNIIVPPQYPGYEMASFTVSELSAIDSPTRELWMLLCIPYTLLLLAFGIGVWLSAGQNKLLRILAMFLIIDAVFGAYWPPMHQRQIIAAGGGTFSDTLHLVWAGITLLLFLIIMALGAMALNKAFRWYTAFTLLVFFVFGYLTSREAPGISEGWPTPHLGIWERVNMGAHMLWVAVLSVVLYVSHKGRKYTITTFVENSR